MNYLSKRTIHHIRFFSLLVLFVLPSLLHANNRNRIYDAYIIGNCDIWLEIDAENVQALANRGNA